MKYCTDIIKILSDYTNNPNAQDNFGETPIQIAAMKGHTDVVITLAAMGGEDDSSTTNSNNLANKHKWTPIHRAAMNGHTEIVRALAELVDNPNVPDEVGWTPIRKLDSTLNNPLGHPLPPKVRA